MMNWSLNSSAKKEKIKWNILITFQTTETHVEIERMDVETETAITKAKIVADQIA